MVNPLPAGSQLVVRVVSKGRATSLTLSPLQAFLETCHSETLLDLDSKRWKNSLPVPACAYLYEVSFASSTNSHNLIYVVVSKGTRIISRGIRSATFNHALPSIEPILTGKRPRKPTKGEPSSPPPSPRSKSWDIPVRVTAGKKHMNGGDATVVSTPLLGLFICGSDGVDVFQDIIFRSRRQPKVI